MPEEAYFSLGRFREVATGDLFDWEQVAFRGPDAPMRIRRISDGSSRSVSRAEFPRRGEFERVDDGTESIGVIP